MKYKNLTYETMESASKHVERWKSLIQEFGVTLHYIKGEANVISDAFICIPMVHHTRKLSDTTLEEDTCELLCLDLLFISYQTDCFSIDMEEISFPLDPQIMKAEQKLDIQDELITNIRTDLNNTNSYWKYKPVEGINIVHYRDRIYVTKTLHKRVLKWYHLYLQHPVGDKLSQTLTTVCRWSDIVDQAQKLLIACKYCQKFKSAAPSMGYSLIRILEP